MSTICIVCRTCLYTYCPNRYQCQKQKGQKLNFLSWTFNSHWLNIRYIGFYCSVKVRTPFLDLMEQSSRMYNTLNSSGAIDKEMPILKVGNSVIIDYMGKWVFFSLESLGEVSRRGNSLALSWWISVIVEKLAIWRIGT